MNLYKKLFNNLMVFGLGNMGSKIISFILVPLYTYYLSQKEYGSVDLVMVTVNMVLPIVTACAHEAVLRFAIDESDSEWVLSNTLTITVVGYFVLLLIYPILNYFNFLEDNLLYLYIILLVQMINQLFTQFTRGIGKVRIFAINGVLITLLTGLLNILFLAILNLGLYGYFISITLAYIFSTVFIFITVKPFKYIKINNLSFIRIKEILAYSIPLIPNYLMWWIINSSSRYIINWFVGIAANGIFAVASKIPSLISIISSVFTQAWQLSVFESYEREKKSKFYSKIFNIYVSILLLFDSLILIFLKPTFSIFFSESFYTAWQPVPFLLLGSVFSALSSFLGVAYTASKETKGVFRTSMIGGGFSIILNIILIPLFGIIGAGVSSMIGFFVMFFVRYVDTKDILSFNIDWNKFLLTLVLIILQTVILFIDINDYIALTILVSLFLVNLIINRNIFEIISFIEKNFIRK
ncbi:lipopolysaccharide biosynthesis protein [Aerococcus urinaeequi]|uniref:Lipopolysaccharide biosynthesis protein n=1 Tax=Aerococcus urinaeequi TaxID=51665 RepID=A0AAF0BJ30_9LACT|nr:lipopolysaccharide biosynthesis protein [Aerococcus urinaeequi]WCG37215.1 lipopolysaccharide biosynthesis protein [Aerococcus urinaeequi]